MDAAEPIRRKARRIAQAIADDIFSGGDKPERLVLVVDRAFGPQHLGGWSKDEIAGRMEEIIEREIQLKMAE